MPKKQTKPKTKSTATRVVHHDSPSLASRPSTWIITCLTVALIFVAVFGIYGMKQAEKYMLTPMDEAKLALFDDLAADYIRSYDVTDNGISEVYAMTGYGISDEDGVFYITFDYADPANLEITYADDGAQTIKDAKHGIMYFWEDTERGGYSHAYSYHEDDYHPSGVYIKK